MLILVGVTVTVAINGGLFEKTKEGAKGTTIERAKGKLEENMNRLKAVILAAGKGTRMNSDLPKVIHQCLGRPMVHYVIQACKDAGADAVCVIVGYKGGEVKNAIYDVVDYAEQKEQLGTGHAVKCAKDFIGTDGDSPCPKSSTV